MGKSASQVILLCEDKLHEVFVRRFLRRGWGIDAHKLRVVAYPKDGSGGSAEQHVRSRFPDELRAFRTRSAKTILIVVMDADTQSVQQHHNELNGAASSANLPVREDSEAVVYVVPKRHIETWLAYLDGVSVDENQTYKSGYEFRGRESDAHPLIDGLTTDCMTRATLNDPPDSLELVCAEFDRMRDHL